jgi:hypothetical protein
MAQIYNVIRSIDAYHPTIGAVNNDDTWHFADVPSYRPSTADLSEAVLPLGVQPMTQLSLDSIMIENYHRALDMHTSHGLPGQDRKSVV